MTRTARLVAAGSVTFLAFLIAEFPASVAVRWVAPASVRLSGVSGSLWRGAASGADLGGLRLGATQWSLSPLSLFLGRLGGEIVTTVGGGKASGTVSVGFSGDVRCTDCKFEGSIAGLRPLIPAIKALDGTISLEATTLEIRKNWATRAVGSAKLANVPLLAPGQAQADGPVASFEATVAADPVPDSGLIEASIHDTGGPLELTARLSVKPPGTFEFSGRARARAGAPPVIVNALAALGPKGSDGRTELALSGSF